MFHAEPGTQGPNPLVVPRTPSRPEQYHKRARSITVAALISLAIGVIGLIVGSVMLYIDFVGSGTLPLPAPVLEFTMALGFGTALVIIVGSVMHLFGWYWLWSSSRTGGVLGAINGINDIIFPVGGGLWIVYYVLPSLGMDIYEMLWVVEAIAAIVIAGLMLLAMLTLGWKTLKA
jgi:hypothetical protein